MAVVETVRGPVDLGNLGRPIAAPNWHYDHITDDVLPALLASGVTQEQIDTMMVENPVRYFTPAKDGAS